MSLYLMKLAGFLIKKNFIEKSLVGITIKL